MSHVFVAKKMDVSSANFKKYLSCMYVTMSKDK